MRRRRFSAVSRSLLLAAVCASSAAAQSNSSDGALFLLLPVGARAVGMGQAMVAERPGSEAVWWNPSAIARQDKKEVAIHHSQTIAATGDAITFVYPTASIGALAVSVNVLNFGDQQITDPGGVPIGVVLPRNILLAATYGAVIGKRFNAGVTYKRLQYRVGLLGTMHERLDVSATSSAVDFGMQYDLPTKSPLTLGAAVRNVGTKLQINDREQADPLPTRIEIGAEYKLPFIAQLVADTEVRLAADVIADRYVDHPAARVGMDVTYEKNIHLPRRVCGQRCERSAHRTWLWHRHGPSHFRYRPYVRRSLRGCRANPDLSVACATSSRCASCSC
jgi:hypothetical protein